MPTVVKIYNQKAEVMKEMELSDKVFNVKPNEALVHQAVVAQMANMRQVLAHTKTRGEVRGGGKKPWRQKGTGRARAGSSRSPIWVGGGVTFGPTKDRNFKKNINQKMSRKAIMMVLTDKIKNDKLIILDKLTVEEFKTKPVNEIINRLMARAEPVTPVAATAVKSKTLAVAGKKEQSRKKNPAGVSGKSKKKRSVLIIIDKKDEKTKYSARNLAGIKLINLDNINILDLIKYKELIVTEDSVKKLEQIYS